MFLNITFKIHVICLTISKIAIKQQKCISTNLNLLGLYLPLFKT